MSDDMEVATEGWFFLRNSKVASSNPHYFRLTEHKNVSTMDALCDRFVDGPDASDLRSAGNTKIRKCGDCRKRLMEESK